MAAKTLYFLDSLASGSNHMALQDGGSAPSAATTGTGWTVAKIAASNYARLDSQTERSSAAFAGTAEPNGAPDNTLGDCQRTQNIINGTFANTNWTIPVPVIAVTGGGDQDGRVRIRIWRSANADGSSATELTGATQTGTTVTDLATGAEQTSTVTWSPGGTKTLIDEYLFVQIAWEITGAGSNNNRDVLLRTGQGITTSDFTPANITVSSAGDIGTAEAFGTPTENLSVLGNSVTTTEAFGTATELLILALNSVNSAEAFSTLSVNRAFFANSVSTSEAFGTLTEVLVVLASSVSSSESVSVPTVAPNISVFPDSITSSEDFPSLQVFKITYHDMASHFMKIRYGR